MWWVARNKDGYLGLYSWCPERYNDEQWSKEYWIRAMRLPRDMFPDLKWEDEPLEVNLVAVPPQNINLDYEVAKALYSELPDKDSLTGISLKNRIDSYEKS